MTKAEPFDRFWNHYPRKVSKGAARKAWAKAVTEQKKTEGWVDLERFIVRCLVALDSQARYRKEHPKDFLPDWKHPATWLNSECWEDVSADQVEKKEIFLPKCKHCDNEVFGQLFDKCEHHLSFDPDNRLITPFAKELRGKYQELNLTPQSAHQQCSDTLRTLLTRSTGR